MTTRINPLLLQIRLNDVENKLKDTEREAAEASTEAKKARDEFNEIKKQRLV